MVAPGTQSRGFTLIELVLVMVIIAIVAGMLAPAIARFSRGRAGDNLAGEIVGLAQYAHAQAIAEARTYRLNFDPNARQFWLTADNGGGTFTAPKNNFGQRFTLPSEILRMQVQLNPQPQPNVHLLIGQNVQQQSVPQSTQFLNGQYAGAGGDTMYNIHDNTAPQYVEFQATGRTDPATITLTDNLNRTLEISCTSPTDSFQVVSTKGGR
jgi:prepilin-type N-terminal cleavage/methylation domain-containing protein